MSCEPLRAELDAYLDGELEPERAAELARHLAGCADCARLLAERRTVAQALRALPRPAAPDGFVEKFRAARAAQAPTVPAAATLRPARGLWRAPWAVGSAAAAAAALLLAVSLHNSGGQPTVGVSARDRAPMAGARSREQEQARRASADAPNKAARRALAKKFEGRDAENWGRTTPTVAAQPASVDGRSEKPASRHLTPAEKEIAALELPADALEEAKGTSPVAAPGPGAAGVTRPAPAAEVPPRPAAPTRVAQGPLPAAAEPNAGRTGIWQESPADSPEAAPKAPAYKHEDGGRAKDLAGALADSDFGNRRAEGKMLQQHSLYRSFTLRAGDTESAALRLTRIAEGLGGREIALRSDDRGEGASWGTAKDGLEASLALQTHPAPAAKPGATDTAASPALPMPPASAEAPARSAGGEQAASVGRQAARQPGQRSIVLAVPASRLEAFQKALALWSESAEDEAKDQRKQDAELSSGFAADASGAPGAGKGAATLRCTVESSAISKAAGQVGDLAETRLKLKAYEGPGIGGGHVRGGGMVYLVITVDEGQ